MQTDRFVIRPAYIQAVKLTGDNIQEIAEWIGADEIGITMRRDEPTRVSFESESMGVVSCEVDDWICFTESDGNIFAMTHIHLWDQFLKVVSDAPTSDDTVDASDHIHDE